MRKKKTFITTLILLTLFGLISSQTSTAKMRGSGDSREWDRFGSAVALSQQYAVIGAPTNKFSGDNSGSVYIFARDGDLIQFISHISASDGFKGDQFGTAVAISDDLILIGAPGASDHGGNSGAAYIFQKSGDDWVEVNKLVPEASQSGDFFGSAVALDGSLALVGAPTERPFGTSPPGFAVLFQKSGANWSELARLSASDGSDKDQFGAAVALDDDRALIGAPHSNSGDLNNSGAAYIFQPESGIWNQKAKLVSSAPITWDCFGSAVALVGNTALIGTPAIGTLSTGTLFGYATIFINEDGSWIKETRLTPDDGERNDRFGTAVALEGNLALIGSPGDDNYGESSGSVYAFKKSSGSWSQADKYEAFTGENGDVLSEAGDQFGFAVALSNDYGLIGIPGAGTFGEDSGFSAYSKLDLASADYLYYIPVYRSGNGNWTGVGLSNLSISDAADVTVEVFSKNGESLYGECFEIPALGQNAKGIALDLTAEGWIRVSSTTPLAGLCFLRDSGFMADIPVTTTIEESLLIPHIAQDNAWDTTILLCNPNETATTVTIIY
ncbi:hypothetical protein KAI46_05355, partial [bacterium]|nr:hypothetical protein [bacterium]